MRRRDETGSRTELEKGQHQQPGILGWLRRNLFQSWISTLQTILVLVVLALAVRWAFSWLVIDADWVVQEGSQACPSDGFCWPFAAHNVHWLLIGWYPKDQLWRAYLSLGLLLICPFLMVRWIHWAWSWRWLAVLLVGAAVLHWILFGGAGLEPLKASRLGGLLLNLYFAVLAVAIGLPGGVAIAVARRSKLPAGRLVAFCFCWLFGSVPTVVLALMSVFFIPLGMPEFDPPIRVFPFAVIFIVAAMAATAFSRPIQAGLNHLPAQQTIVADSLGLNDRAILRRIQLPQVMIGQAPTLVAMSVWVLLETPLLIVIGLHGIFGMGQNLMTDMQWLLETGTMVAVAAVTFLAIGLAIRRYGRVCEVARQDRTGGRGPLVYDPFPAP